MLIKKRDKALTKSSSDNCVFCNKNKAEIVMWGYAYRQDIEVCKSCAIQLARKLLEDICDLGGDKCG